MPGISQSAVKWPQGMLPLSREELRAPIWVKVRMTTHQTLGLIPKPPLRFEIRRIAFYPEKGKFRPSYLSNRT